MMQSLHHATAVAVIEPMPAAMTMPEWGMAWNQPDMPKHIVNAPWQARKGQGDAATKW